MNHTGKSTEKQQNSILTGTKGKVAEASEDISRAKLKNGKVKAPMLGEEQMDGSFLQTPEENSTQQFLNFIEDRAKEGISHEKAVEEWQALKDSKKVESINESLFDGELVLEVKADAGNKFKITARNKKGELIHSDIFNIGGSPGRVKFVRDLKFGDEDQNTEIARALLRLSDKSKTLQSAKDTIQKETVTVETSFKVLSVGIIEQIRGGFAFYDPETNTHKIIDSIIDEDGVKYVPVEDDLFSIGGFYIADDLTEYGTTVELDTAIEKYLSTYIDLKPVQLKIAAKYARFTYLFDKVLELPYINATGDSGTGKSRFGGAEVMICRRGLYLITPSAASIYRIADKFHPTMFFDEFNGNDSDDDAAITQICNAGFQKTGMVAKQLSTGDGSYKTELFDPYCPKIIGSLKQAKSQAFNSRCIPVTMERTTRNDIPLRLTPKMLADAQQLQNKLTLYRLRHYNDDLEQKLNEAEIILKEHKVINRTAQVNIPLFAIIDDKQVRAEYIKLLKGYDKGLVAQKQQTLDGEIIDKIHTLLFKEDEKGIRWNEKNIDSAPEQDKVCEALTIERLHGMINANRQKEIEIRYFGKLIIGLGLHTKKILQRESPHYEKRAIVFDYERLKYLFTMYDLSFTEDFNVSNVSNGDKRKDSNDLSVLTLNENNAQSEIQCQQANLSDQSTYASADIADIKKQENKNCKHCGHEAATYLNEIYCPIGCGTIEAAA